MEQNIDWSDKTILIVEDEQINIFFFITALRDTGAKLLYAYNGEDGVKQALENDEIDCVLMDVRMPKMDGYEATQKIRAAKPDLPIITQTAYAMTNEREKAFEAGCTDYITKPIRLNVLFDTLVKYLGT